jgi:hypothetical protein
MLVASKPVKITKRGVRIRERYAATDGVVSDTRRLWTGANTIGDEQFLCSLVAEAMMENILRSIKDTRSDKDAVTDAGFLSRIIIKFQRNAIQFGNSAVSRELRYDVTAASNSFNGMVYNNILGASPNLSYIDGSSSAVTQRGLRDHLYDFAVEGYYPEKLFLYRIDSGFGTHEILRDTQYGRSNIKMSIAGLHKFQNVTPADNVDAAQYNANAIDANPLSGKIYTFRNLAPRFNPGWLTSQSVATQSELERMAGRPANRVHWDYKQLSSGDSAAGVAMPSINEFKLPVLRTRAVFSNAKTSTNISIPPGGFKIFKTRFTYDGTIVRLLRDITQVMQQTGSMTGTPNQTNSGADYPSLGDSFLLCLTPSMKTGGADDAVTLGFDFTKDGQAYMTKYTAGTMPTTNVVE